MGVEQIFVVSVLYLVVKKVVVEGKRSNKLSLLLMIFGFYTAYLLKQHLHTTPPNAYQLLNLPRTFSTEEIKDSYKQTLKYKHPDKNRSENAEEEFRELKKNYELIKTADARIKYETLGEISESTAFGNSIAFYLGWVFTCNMIYFSKTPNAGRNLLCLVTLFGLLESFIMAKVSFYFNVYLLPLTVFEQVNLVKALFPAFTLLMVSWETLRIHDTDEDRKKRVQELLEAGGKELFQVIKAKTQSVLVSSYMNRVKTLAEKKYKSSALWKVVPLILVAYFVFGKNNN
jgi:hypothetical protein